MIDPAKSGGDLFEELLSSEKSVGATKDLFDKESQLKEQDTRTSIALFFVRSYFLLFALLILGIPLYNLASVQITGTTNLVLDLNDLLLTFSSVIGSALGFVIGYYFKLRE